MIRSAIFDAEMLRRYDTAGPRYTSYPTAPQFHAGFDCTEFRKAVQISNSSPAPAPLSLYVHVPFCQSPCFYCGCNRVISRDAARAAAYVDYLRKEIDLIAPLFSAKRSVVQLHFGGGTPNFLTPAQLEQILTHLKQYFAFADSAEGDFSIELDPRFVDADSISALAEIGFNRASLGVQDINADVQRAINRVQSSEKTQHIINACRTAKMRSVNVDLIYGLPQQSMEGFAKTLDEVICMRPERLAVYGYAHLPHLFKAQKQIEPSQLPNAETKLALLGLAIDALSDAGYMYIGMDHFALPEDTLAQAQANGALHRNFMGYTTHAKTDLLGFGVSAISHIGASFSQNPRDLPSWQAALDAQRLPVFRGMWLDADDQLRAALIQALMCQAQLSIPAFEAQYQIDFHDYFKDALARLQPLQADGLVDIDGTTISATRKGRLLLRNIAMCFDRYLHQPSAAIAASHTATAQYSRAI